MYEQTLYKIVTPVKLTTISRLNKAKKWEYGYNKEHDIVVISKTGQIGEIYNIQNLKIALPKAPPSVDKSNKKWTPEEYPKELKSIESIFDWRDYPESFKLKWESYIDEQFNKRENGHWFNNKGLDTYITGTHFMYLQWSKIDVGQPDFRESNRLFYIFWEACKADTRCYGMSYLKNRRSGFSFMASGETVNMATISSDARFGILSKSGADAKKMFTDKVVPISVNYPSSLNRSKTVWTGRRRNLPTESPRQSLLVSPSLKPLGPRPLTVLIPPSIGKTPVITRTMEKN
tara:strand:+ start:2569 stop:3435 length:867 start_codon:yes stop_codon:yes gene_type:complete